MKKTFRIFNILLDGKMKGGEFAVTLKGITDLTDNHESYELALRSWLKHKVYFDIFEDVVFEYEEIGYMTVAAIGNEWPIGRLIDEL